MTSLNLARLVNPAFDDVLFSPLSHIVLKGGRGSTKSSVISVKLVNDFLNDPLANVVVLRKVGKYLRMSVYEQIKWAIYQMGVSNQFLFGTSPLKITHRKTGTAFYFYGVDDPMKLKSQKISKGYVSALWFEELAEFSGREDIDVVEDTFIRQRLPDGKHVKVYFSYNPPRNPYDWINEWIEEKTLDPTYLVHHSTYLDDTKNFLSKEMKEKIERYKTVDPDYYRWMYLGEVIGLGTNVYNMALFHQADSFSEGEVVKGQFFAVDSGHQQSATTCLHLVMTSKNRIYLVDTYYYSPAGKVKKKAPSVLTRELFDFFKAQIKLFPHAPVIKQTIDSAEGALRNQFEEDYGLVWHPVAKKKKIVMTEFVQSLLAEGRFYYFPTENNLRYFIEEHKKYMWDEKSILNDDPKVVKEDDHTCDAFQYFVMDNLRLLGLKA